jgi:hypothetical protein
MKDIFQFKKENLSYDILSWEDPLPTLGVFVEALFSIMKAEKKNSCV